MTTKSIKANKRERRQGTFDPTGTASKMTSSSWLKRAQFAAVLPCFPKSGAMVIVNSTVPQSILGLNRKPGIVKYPRASPVLRQDLGGETRDFDRSCPVG